MMVERLWSALARPVRRGYSPPPLRDLAPRWWLPAADGSLEELDAGRLGEHFAGPAGDPVGNPGATPGGVGFVLPTALGRTRDSLARRVSDLWRHAVEAARDNDLPVILVVGLQWFEGEETEALELLHAALADCSDPGDTPARVLGLSLRGPGKVETLRTCLPVRGALGLRALGWVDDDVLLDPGCLSRLVEAFLERGGRPCVLGAAKVPHRRESRASRWLFALKQRMDPAINYPHGCCMLVDAALFDRGIPDRYCCDDGYFCYEVLQRTPDEAGELLALVPEARCHYEVGAERGRLLPRLRRLLLNHVIFLADYPPAVGAKYLGDYLYPGFWPISRSPTEDGGRSGPVRWGLQAFHLFCLSTIVLELALRGLLGRPLREIRWSS